MKILVLTSLLFVSLQSIAQDLKCIGIATRSDADAENLEQAEFDVTDFYCANASENPRMIGIAEDEGSVLIQNQNNLNNYELNFQNLTIDKMKGRNPLPSLTKNYFWFGGSLGLSTTPGLELDYKTISGKGVGANFAYVSHGPDEKYYNFGISYAQPVYKTNKGYIPKLMIEGGGGVEQRSQTLRNVGPDLVTLSYQNNKPYIYVGPTVLWGIPRSQRVFFEFKAQYKGSLTAREGNLNNQFNRSFNPAVGMKIRFGKN